MTQRAGRQVMRLSARLRAAECGPTSPWRWASSWGTTRALGACNCLDSACGQITPSGLTFAARGLASKEDKTTGGIQISPGVQSADDGDISGGERNQKGRNFIMMFTCTVCNTRSAKAMSKHAYEKGVVLVRCPGCENLHLIADRLGWFGEPGSIENFLAERNESVMKGFIDDTFEITPEAAHKFTH